MKQQFFLLHCCFPLNSFMGYQLLKLDLEKYPKWTIASSSGIPPTIAMKFTCQIFAPIKVFGKLGFDANSVL